MKRYDNRTPNSNGGGWTWDNSGITECEDGELVLFEDVWQTVHSARFILSDADPEKLADACGLPLGVITAALRNIVVTEEDE